MDCVPVKPDPSDCCNSVCTPCILDVYEEQLKKYNQKKNATTRELRQNCLSTTSYSIFVLKKVSVISSSARLYTFEYIKPLKDPQSSTSDRQLFFNPGQYFLLKANDNDDSFTRAYTPLTFDEENLISFTILVKLIPNGKMSKYLSNLKKEEETLWRGPYGDFQIDYDCKHILFVAQGTGIAPVYSIIRALLENEECYTFLKLLYCCSDSDNIYLRNELHSFLSYWNFSCEMFVHNSSNCTEKFNETIHGKKLCENNVRSYFNDVDKNNVLVIVCGSETFTNAIKEQLIHCFVNEDKIYVF